MSPSSSASLPRRVGRPSRSAAFAGCVLALAAGACSSSEPAVAEVTEDDVVLAYVDQGTNEDVADCFVGLGQREFALETLLPGAAPDVDAPLIDEILTSCRDAVAIIDADEIPPRQSFDVGPFNIGDDMYLDDLWVECERGDGTACDALWEEAPVGSVYESFGVTCGNRPEILDCASGLTSDGDGADGTDVEPVDEAS